MEWMWPISKRNKREQKHKVKPGFQFLSKIETNAAEMFGNKVFSPSLEPRCTTNSKHDNKCKGFSSSSAKGIGDNTSIAKKRWPIYYHNCCEQE